MKEYYKKIDKSFFKYGITIPNDYVSMFVGQEALELGKKRDITIIFKGKEYTSNLYHVNRKTAKDVYQIRWDNNYEFLTELKKEFIQSYFAIESQDYIAKENDKYYVTNLLGGNQEVAIFKELDSNVILLETFIRIETLYDPMFKKIVEQNVFGWLSKVDDSIMITKSTSWYNINELHKHADTPFVVYYLIDSENKEIYIGSAKRLGDRVKPKRPEIPGWNKFRYEIVHPKFHSQLRAIEYHSIMNCARFIHNNGNLKNANISEYRLVNKDYKYYQK